MSDIQNLQNLQAVGLLTVVLYAVFMFLARAHLIAWNSVHSLEGRVESVKADLTALGPPDSTNRAVTKLTEEVDALTKRAGGWGARLVSSGGEENQGWEMIHHAEEMLIGCIGDDEVHARLLRARADLAGDETACGTKWRALVDRHLDEGGNRSATWSGPAARADLHQVVEYCHRKQDESFRTLADVSNKTQWLVVAGLLFITAVILLEPSVVPLLGIGAVGGLASRIRLISHASSIPTDYGAFWAPLFLAPVLGALLGWSGIYLVQLAGALAVFSEEVSTALMDVDTGPAAYGLALLFGFTEGAFNGVATLVNDALTTARQGDARSTVAAAS